MPHKDPETRRKWQRANYLKNKERILAYPGRKMACRKYRKTHPEKTKQYSKEYYYDKKEKLLTNTKVWRERNARYVKSKDHAKTAQLTDAYMRKHLIKLGYSRTQIRLSPELIESHRLIIKIKRLCKTSKN